MGAAAGGHSATIAAAVGVQRTGSSSQAPALPIPGHLPSAPEFTVTHRCCNYAATPCQSPHGSAGVCAGMGRVLLACYYPFTQLSRLISFQMGRINWFRSEHQACLIEMDSFPFPNGHLPHRCWMGREGCSLPILDPHCCSSSAQQCSLHLGRSSHFSVHVHAQTCSKLCLQGVQVPPCLGPL